MVTRKGRLVLGVVVVALAVAACGLSNSSTTAEQKVVDSQQQQYEKVQPIPFYDYSAQRQALIDIYNSQNLQQQTWDVVTSYSGQFLFECEAQGWPIPADAQLSNPLQIAGAYLGNNSTWETGVVGQAEPNGVYTGNTQGTYILCIRADGKLSPVYTENNVQMFPFPVTIDPATGQIKDAGGPSNITFTDIKGAAGHAAPTPTP